MAQHDGSINLDVRLNRNDFFKGVNEIKSAIKSLQTTVEDIGRKIGTSTVSYIKDIGKNVDTVNDKVEKVSDNMGAFENNVSSSAENIRGIESAINQTAESAEKMREATDGQTGDGIRTRIVSLEQEAKWLQEVKAHYDELLRYTGADKASKRAATYLNSAQVKNQYQAIASQIADVTSELAKLHEMEKSMPNNGMEAITDEANKADEATNKLNANLRDTVEIQGKTVTAQPRQENQTPSYDLKAEMAKYLDAAKKYFTATKAFESAAADAKKGMDASVVGYTKAMRNNVKATQEFEDKLKELRSTRDELSSKRDEMVNKGQIDQESDEYNQITEQLKNVNQELERVEKIKNEALKPPYMQEWEKIPTITGKITETFYRLKSTGQMALYAIQHPLQAINQGLAVATSSAWRFVQSIGKTVLNGAVNGLKAIGSSAIQAARNLARIAGTAALSFLKKLAVNAKNAAVQLAKLAGRAITTGIKKVASLAATASKSILGLNKSAKGDGLKEGLRLIIRYGFGVRSLFMLVRRLRAAFADAFKSMAERVPEVNKSLSNLTNSLGMLKNSLATAFQPIVTAIEPALVRLMDSMSAVMARIGIFFATITGQNYIYKATKGQESYADSLKKTSKAAKEAKNQLAGFDHLNILSDNNSGGSGDSDADDLSGGFKKVPIENGISEFARRIKDAFNSGEFANLGKIVADKFNEIIRSIKWNQIGRRIGNSINNIVDTINGLFDNVDWAGLGRSLADGIMALVDAINWYEFGRAATQKISAIIKTLWGLIKGIKWKRVGKSIGNFIQGAFDNIPWEMLGEMVGNAITGVFNAILTAVRTFKWENAGQRIAKAFNSLFSTIDAPTIATTLIEIINGALNSMMAFVDNFDWQKHGQDLADGIMTFVSNLPVDKVGEALTKAINGILGYILPTISNPELWVEIGDKFAGFISKVFSDDELWNKLKTTLISMVRGAILALRSFIGSLKWGETGTKFHNFIMGLADDFPTDELGDALMEALESALLFMANVLDPDGTLGTKLGAKLAGFMNRIFGNQKFWKQVGITANNMLKNILSFGKSFLETFKPEDAANNIKAALSEIKWKEIAEETWRLAKLAFSKAGQFVAAIFDIDESQLEKGETLAQAIGSKVGKILGDIPWGAIFETVKETIIGFASEMITELMDSKNGQILLMIGGGILALKVGIIPLIVKLISGLAAGFAAGGPEIATGLAAAFATATSIGVTHVLKLGEDLVEAQRQLDEALANETDSGLSNYIYLFTKYGADTANEWARMSYGIVLESNNLYDNLQVVGKGIATVQGETFDGIQSNAALAMAAYKKVFAEGGAEVANKWAEDNLAIQLTSQNLQTNLDALSTEIIGTSQFTENNMSQLVKEVCTDILTEGTETSYAVQSAVTDAAENTEKAVDDSTKSIENTTSNRADTIENNIVSPYQDGSAETKKLLSDIEKAVDSSMGNIQTTVDGTDVATPMKTEWNAASSSVRSITKGMETNLSGSMQTMASDTSAGVQEQSKPFYDSWKAILWVVSNGVSSMESTISRGMGSIASTVSNGMGSVARAASSVNWWSVGDSLVAGIQRGVRDNWPYLENTVRNLALRLFRTARNTLGIHSPSKLFRDEVGFMIGAGLAEGLDDSQRTVLDSMSNMATAMVDEMQNTDLTADVNADGDTMLNSLQTVLSTFSDNVENSFTSLMERLQSIADHVTFKTPDIAAGAILPYAIQGTTNTTSDELSYVLNKSNEELISTLMQLVNNQTTAIVRAIEEYSGTQVNIDKKSITDVVIDEINRRTRSMGGSPLLI